MNIPEGARANFLFLGLRDGYLVQKLPFSIELEDFRIEHYPSGMPKSFESTILIHDKDLKEPLKKDISVNHPLIYKGLAIYQASFSDGGSELKLKAWSLDMPLREPLDIDTKVSSQLKLTTPRGDYNLEISDFKMFNIFPLPDNDPSGKKFQNYGPSVIFKLRAANGEAREYVNYMAPVIVDGRPFFLSGMRASQAEDYRFLHIPVDANGGVERFMRFLALARDEDRVKAVARRQAETELGITPQDPSSPVQWPGWSKASSTMASTRSWRRLSRTSRKRNVARRCRPISRSFRAYWAIFMWNCCARRVSI